MKYRHKITGDIAVMKPNNSSFYVYDGLDIHARIVENSHDWELVTETMFKTYDGFDIKTGWNYHFIVESECDYKPWQVNTANCDWTNPKKPPLGHKQFYLLEKAEEYIIDNKPCLSLNDVKEARLKGGNTIQVLRKHIKEKLGL